MLKIYNTLTRKREIFKPQKKGKVDIFVCGPTVYDFSHIGHARTYIVFDVIAKYLRQKGCKVYYLQNITDIDDKIIKRAKETKTTPKKLALKFEKEYFKDMKALNINSVTKYARATDHIKEIISQVKRLLEKGYAYEIGDGIYFDISRFKDYGKLSKRTVLQAEDAVSRIDEAKGKRNKGDFCLWKFSKPEEPKWKSPWGLGRPGWHIEDTAITEKYFGPQYDIHGGARDLIFPHHEAEICQMEAISGKAPMVKYWLHTGFLTVKGVKMAKSLGNFITIRDFLKQHSPRILRLFVIKTHYRSPIDYSEKEIQTVKRQLERIDEFVDKIEKLAKKTQKPPKALAKNLVLKTKKDFEKAMEDDFNTPKALACVFKLVSKGNLLISQNKLAQKDAKEILKFLEEIDKVFNFIFWQKPKKKKIPKKVLELVKAREKYRKEKKWKEADKIRQKIKQMGYWIEDTKEGPKIKPL
jgi:cysteinyl-tRNA synthetase